MNEIGDFTKLNPEDHRLIVYELTVINKINLNRANELRLLTHENKANFSQKLKDGKTALDLITEIAIESDKIYRDQSLTASLKYLVEKGGVTTYQNKNFGCVIGHDQP